MSDIKKQELQKKKKILKNFYSGKHYLKIM